MTITIPPEAFENAKNTYCRLIGNPKIGAVAEEALEAACLAMLKAWPGMAPHGFYTANGPRDGIILPLTEPHT